MKYLPYLLIFLVTIIIGYSYTIFIENDYSFYFVSSEFLSDSRVIYKEIFTHKGPLYFCFLFLIKLIFGSEELGYHFGFIITVLLFSLVSYKVMLKKNPTLNKYLIICIIFSLFFNQNTNSSIQFFILTFLCLFFYNIEKYNENKAFKNLILSSIFLSVSIFTRIDSIFYVLILFFVFISLNKNEKIKFLLVQTLIPLIVYFTLKILTGFSHIDFYNHNIEFNFLYAKMDSSILTLLRKLIYRRETFILLCVTGSILYIHKIFKISYSINYLILITSLFLFTITFSDKNYHILIFLYPFLYYLIDYIKNNDYRFFTISSLCALFVLAYSISRIYTYESLSKVKESHDDRLQILYDKDLNHKSLIYGGEAYINFYLKDLNHQSINNWWLYRTIGFEKNEKLIEDHNRGLKLETPFYINYGLFEDPKPNKWTKEILENTIVLDKIGDYYKLQKIK